MVKRRVEGRGGGLRTATSGSRQEQYRYARSEEKPTAPAATSTLATVAPVDDVVVLVLAAITDVWYSTSSGCRSGFR